ncbi:class I SAM-dependent methyltransferase [Niabella yanshanensis]|uniref:Class I SAM-dependent methyltransferase n=1 Tax=Niabella yanshanensis TaxID=577386 RepID=A0ABZ0WD24_9BACT|nr:class I SAM-dependent methyltransferase [Niabella yanshanensis]WQD40616.1 class I SAM-dependent methyltransferase [Niabella yanshanensis]
MATQQELEQLAAQLRQPNGAAGIDVANMMNENNIGMTYHSINRLGLHENQKVLELGHGNGGHIGYLLNQAERLQYTGLEMSELMMKEARRINQQLVENRQAAFFLYDGDKTSFNDNSFDKVFTVNTIYFWKNPVALLNEINRITVDGGWFNITFAQKAFMQTLPFVQFGFELYDTKKAEQLVAKTAWKIAGTVSETETVKTKTGDLVEREFTTITLVK